ncbi:MAG: DUF3857 domain-containing protein [Crocinitomicaceae bacterium]|nr:DUF3857 domain-containing protein [Crocinitomicaceae bacterium]
MKSYILVFAFLISSFDSIAQKYPIYDNYKWEKTPVLDTQKIADVLYYYPKYFLAVEYEFDPYYGEFFKYKTMHYRVKLNSHIAIESFNKVYISMEDVVDLKSLKARVIKPSGVVDLKPKVEEFYSDEESEQYYYFPVSGIELGDEIEILYTLKMKDAKNGDQFYFQGEVPIFNFDFYFVSPNDAYWDFLAHNGLPEPKLVDTIPHKNQWVSHLDTMPAFKYERFAEYNNVTMKLDVSLKGFNTASDNSYSPYDYFEKDLNSVYNVVYKGKDLKKIQELSAKLGLSPRNKDEVNVRIIENYIKMNIDISSSVPLSTPIATLIETERASSIGTILLFMALFQENDVEFEYGFISDRYETHFSDEIESWYFMQSYIFHFPGFNGYLAPLHFASRLGYLDASWVPNNALLFSMKYYPKPETKGKVKPVPGTTARQNIDSTVIRINVHDDYTTLDIEVERYLFGYKAGEFQSYYYLYNDARRKEEENKLLDVLNDYSDFKMTSIQNTDPEDAFYLPLIIKGVVTELNIPLIEVAGDKLIFRLGSLYGEYTDLKDIYKKKTDFVFGNASTSSETVEIVFPEGTKVTPAQLIPESDDLCPHEGITVYSHFKIEGNKVFYTEGSSFDSHRYSIDEKDVLADVFKFWNSLHKMNLVIEKKN